MKSVIAVASPVRPASDCIMPPPIMPPPIETWVPPDRPSIMPSAASFIMAVTMPDEDGMPTVFAYCDIAARVMP